MRAFNAVLIGGAVVSIGAGVVLFSGCLPDPSKSIEALAELEGTRNQVTLEMIDLIQLVIACGFVLCVGIVGAGFYFVRLAIFQAQDRYMDIHQGKRLALNPESQGGRIEHNQAAYDVPVLADDRYMMEVIS